ncbi:hypothetical protein, partial [Petrachloros mirabilis]
LHRSGQTYRLAFALKHPDHYSLVRRIDNENWQELGTSRKIVLKTVLELALPFKNIQFESSQPLEMSLVVKDSGLEIACYPRHQPATVMTPGPDFEANMWRV